MVESHAVGDPGTAIVADDGEPIVAEVLHQFDEGYGHRPFRQPLVVIEGHVTIAVSRQVGSDDRTTLGELRGDGVPADVGLGISVDQQDRRPRTQRAVDG